ncbi:MAG TPA: MlaD family protein [Solirubrobacteraceae bacterium]|nr:MlaD family protein [Solirubrobacteraceae bacterium]
MVTQAPRRSAVFAALAFALSCVGLIVFVWTQFGGTVPLAPEGYRVSARFHEAGLLVTGADVRISGVTVGRVAAIANRGVDSVVTMEIDPPYAPLPADTHAILRLKTLLGEGFIALSAGTRHGPTLRDGGTIPAAHVLRTQSLDQVLATFDPSTQHAFANFLTGSATSLAGRGAQLSDAIGNLDPALTELTAMASELDRQSGDVRGVIAHGARVLTTLGDRAAALQTLIRSGATVLSATAGRDRALGATVDALPPLLTQLRRTLGTLDGTVTVARPSLAALTPVAPLLAPALRDAIRLSGPAVDLLHAAPGLLSAADAALPAVGRLVGALRPGVDALLPAVRELAPQITFVAHYRAELVTAMANLSAALQATAPANAIGGSAHYLRAITQLSNESVYGQSVREPTDRSNAYFSPGELSAVASGGLQSASCANTANPAQVPVGGANVPCRVQPPFRWGHGLLTAYFPHVRRAPRPR